MLRAAALTQYRRVTDRRTDGQTDGQDGIAVANTALACEHCTHCKNVDTPIHSLFAPGPIRSPERIGQ